MRTAAFSSKPIYVPSPRPNDFLTRTTTAWTTSPFFTEPPGVASFTVPTMMSPTPAYRRCDPPLMRMQRSSRAPVLSATLSLVSTWIIVRYLSLSLEGLLSPLQDAHEAPALRLGERPTLAHDH